MTTPQRALYLGVFMGSITFSTAAWALLIVAIGNPLFLITAPCVGVVAGMATMATLRWLGLEG